MQFLQPQPAMIPGMAPNQFMAPPQGVGISDPDAQMFNTAALNLQGVQAHPSQSFQVEVAALYLQETGTFDDMYRRDYVASDPENFVNNLANNVVANRNVTAGTVFSQVASNMIDLDARRATAVVIPNGWDTRRFRFMLQTRERSRLFPGTVYYTYVQGFTEQMGVSLQTQQIDDQMVFFINSFIRIAEFTQNTANGGQQLVHRIQQQGQLLNGVLVGQQNPMGATHFLRPVDVYAGLQVQRDQAFRSSDVFDLRNNTVAGSNSVLNNFANNTPTHYLSRLATPIVAGLNSVNHGGNVTDYVGSAVGNASAAEPTIDASPLLALLQRNLNRPGGSTFTMSELAMIDPTVGQRTHVRTVASSFQASIMNRGRGADWNNAYPETLMATKLLNSIPGVLWQNYIGSASFSFTNGIGANRVEIKVDNIRSFTVSMPPDAVANFYRELEEVIARDISYNHQMMFSVSINVSVLNEIQINVSVNGGPSLMYIAPCFSSGSLNSVYTHQNDNFERMVNLMHSFSDTMHTLANQESSGLQINNSI